MLHYTLWLLIPGLSASSGGPALVTFLCICSAALKGVRGHHHTPAHTHTHTHKHNMSLLHSPETSCHWQELKMPPMRMWKQANINRCARSYIPSMYACLFHSLGFILMCMDIQISTRITGNMMRHARNAYSAGVEGSRRVEPCVKPRSALSCFRRNTPRNSVVCGAKTSAVAGRATYCTMTQNTNSRTHKFMHMSHPGTWRTQTPQQVLQVSLSLLAFQSLLIPSVLCCSDSWESQVKAVVASMAGR